jgi:hypothetical protein
MSLASKILLAVLLLPFLGFAAWFIRYEMRTPQDEREVMDRQIELVRAGRYDKASQVIETWLTDPRRDASRDGLLYQQLAVAYFGKAWSKPSGKRDSSRQANLNLEKELNLYNRENAAGLRVDLVSIARGHEVLGDLSNEDNCLYYAKAIAELTRQMTLVKGDSYEADGKKFSLDPLRRDINKHLDGVRDKATKAGCPSVAGKN